MDANPEIIDSSFNVCNFPSVGCSLIGSRLLNSEDHQLKVEEEDLSLEDLKFAKDSQ